MKYKSLRYRTEITFTVPLWRHSGVPAEGKGK